MTNIIGAGVTLKGFNFEDSLITCNLKSGIVIDDIGKAVTIDTTANTVRLAGDGDPIDGRLETVEDRAQEGILVGTVAFRFANTLPIKTGETVVIGSAVQGAGSGEVKPFVPYVDTDGTSNPSVTAGTHSLTNRVVEIDGTNAIVLKV